MISPDRDDDTGRSVRLAVGRVEAELHGTANPNNFKYVARPRLLVVGEALLASGWLLTIGLLNLFYAIQVLAGLHIFITTASGWSATRSRGLADAGRRPCPAGRGPGSSAC